MLRYVLIGMLVACASDIAVIYSDKNNDEDTAQSIGVAEPADDPWNPDDTNVEPAGEPSSEMTDLTIGYAEMYLTQIACPACMGVSYEFDIGATLKLHQPTDGDYNEWLTPVGTCVTQELGSYVSSTPLSIVTGKHVI